MTVCGPKGAIEKVRILWPVRGKTQVEILAGDCFKLGLKAPARLSGDLDGTPGVTLVGPKGSVQTKGGRMAAPVSYTPLGSYRRPRRWRAFPRCRRPSPYPGRRWR